MARTAREIVPQRESEAHVQVNCAACFGAIMKRSTPTKDEERRQNVSSFLKKGVRVATPAACVATSSCCAVDEPIVCFHCKEQAATLFCREYCGNCCHGCHSGPIAKKHATSPQPLAGGDEARVCSNHDQVLILQCECGAIICRDCTLVAHPAVPGHKKTELKDVVRGLQAEVQAVEDRLRVSAEKMRSEPILQSLEEANTVRTMPTPVLRGFTLCVVQSSLKALRDVEDFENALVEKARQRGVVLRDEIQKAHDATGKCQRLPFCCWYLIFRCCSVPADGTADSAASLVRAIPARSGPIELRLRRRA